MTELVGILNLTPDSFSDGGLFNQTVEQAVDRVQELLQQGAAFVDVGAESTKPHAIPLTPDEEWARLQSFFNKFPGDGSNLSLDTYHPETAGPALDSKPRLIINDVTSLALSGMSELIHTKNVRCIISHLPLSAHGNIQAAHQGELIDDIEQVKRELEQIIAQSGIKKENIIVDPGIGFGKTPELNWRLLEFARVMPDYPVMIGYSRKRFLGESRMELAPNLEAGRIAIAAGATYLRVHDVVGHASLVK